MIQKYRRDAFGYLGAALISLPIAWLMTRWEEEHLVLWGLGIMVLVFGFYGGLIMGTVKLFKAKGYSGVLGLVGITVVGAVVPFFAKDKSVAA